MIVVLCLIDPLLGTDLEISNETIAVVMQRSGKYASTTVELLPETVFSMWPVPRSYLEDNWGDTFSCRLTESYVKNSGVRDELCTGGCGDRT
jgi:hypothetical protein